MARRKSSKVRPTLAEIKEQPGKYVIATVEGEGAGPISIAAIPPLYTPADAILPHMLLEPYKPTVIADIWLDDGRFARIYNRNEGIRVWRSDEIPEEKNLMALPPEIETALLSARAGPILKHNAFRVATEPYDRVTELLLNATDDTKINEQALLEFELSEIRPFLLAVLYYEKHLHNRKKIIDIAEKRLLGIADKTSVKAQMAM